MISTVASDPHREVIAQWLDGSRRKRWKPWRRRKYLRRTFSEKVAGAVESIGDPLLAQSVHRLWEHPYFAFEPRKDQPGIDEQTGFMDADSFISVILGGNGCLAPWQKVFDPVAGVERVVSETRGKWHVRAIDPATGQRVTAEADEPWMKGRAPLYRWTLESGESFEATADHRVCTTSGFMTCRQAFSYGAGVVRTSSRSPLASSSESARSVHGEGGLSSLRRAAGCQCSCWRGSRPDDGRLLAARAGVQGASPSQAGALERIRNSWRPDGLGCTPGYIPTCPWCDPPSMSRSFGLTPHAFGGETPLGLQPCSRPFETAGTHGLNELSSTPAFVLTPASWLLLEASLLAHSESAFEQAAKEMVAAWCSSPSECTRIVKCEYITTAEFYDLGVPGFGNYELAGAIHANSGKTYVGAQRVVQFLESNPAPARDTPFWVIGPTYEISCGSCWAQKLCDILPEEWIDWGRITWINSKKNWPDVVPLLDPDGHGMRSTKRRNWSLQFKSYEQGRELMQAKAIGGAWFTEQFPQQVFDEVLRGLREYAGKVSAPVWMEFTPIDPARALFMERKFEEWEQGELPDWSFWKFHTTAAMEAGHVDEGWHRTFFSGVSEEMLETRQAGSFASYEGTIYKTFRRGVHTVTRLAIPPGVQHRRAVDWGEGEHNALVMLWAYRDSLGTWYVYDEYYSTDQTMLYREHCAAMRSKREYDWEHHPVIYGATYAPPDRPGMFREFSANGIPCTTAKTSVLEGIEAVRAALKIRPLTGEPGLIIDEVRCPNLVREMRTYRWIQPTENSKNPRDPKPEPLKFNDHAVDALRYLIYSEHSRIQAAIPKAMNALPDRRAGMPAKSKR